MAEAAGQQRPHPPQHLNTSLTHSVILWYDIRTVLDVEIMNLSIRGGIRAAPTETKGATGSPTMHAARVVSRRWAATLPRVSRLYASTSDEFYSSSRFEDVVGNRQLATLLENANYKSMSTSQEMSYGPLIRGESVVLAAETGSGKTLAYLVPLVESMLAGRQGEGGDDGASGKQSALVLCPNAMLCEQVVTVVRDVFQPVGIKCAYISSQNVTYDDSQAGFPDVVVTTPVALHSLLTGVGPLVGPEWTFEGLRSWARYVVLDEADMLLGGAYGKKIDQVLDELRGGDRERAALRACEEVGIDMDAYWSLPRHIRKAAQLHGGRGMLDAGVGDHVEVQLEDGKLRTSHVWLRQYAFVAATMPQEGRETVGQKIADDYPNIQWINGVQLHKTLKHVEFRWVDVGVNDQMDALIRVIEQDVGRNEMRNEQDGQGEENESGEQTTRMIVFAKNTASSKGLASRLESAFEGSDVTFVSYHKGMSQQDRAGALQALRDEDQAVVLVCTDATARGLDVPGVSHVVHADFPASAIDFLHRSGRTGRAGRRGVVTSLVQPESQDLADAIKDLMEDDDTIDGAFSRNRSFRKKHKKYGRFVKRGEVG